MKDASDQPERHRDRRRRVLTDAIQASRPLMIADVGANPTSTPAYAPLVTSGLAHVYGFEPNQEAWAELQEQKGPNETYFCKAIGRSGDRTLYLHPNSGLTSLYKMAHASLKQIGFQRFADASIEPVPLSPADLDELSDLPRLDLLKMDLQGGEVEVLDGAQDRLSHALAVVPEVRFHRMYEGEPMLGDVDVRLREMGFRLHKFLFTTNVIMPNRHNKKLVRREVRSQLLDGDAVYVRDVDYAADFSDDQLIHMMLLAETVFDSVDFVLHLMDILVDRKRLTETLPDKYIAHLRKHQRVADAT